MMFQSQSVSEFLDAVAAKAPTPGGGAVASVTASLASALAQMVLRYSQGKKSLAEHASFHERALHELEQAAVAALDLAEADAEAYGRLNALWKLDQDDPARREQWADAVASAIDPPRRIVTLNLAMLELMHELLGKTNTMLDSDLAIAAVLADAAARAGAWSVRINLPLMDDADEARQLEQQVEQNIARSRALCEQIEARCKSTM